mmetsp:Transcript_25228/g.64086  ORF Transcript_25228/g.64086 Transcript_25228/m.64086 type:complete len:231 (-) Transcript_25228:1734-2426(-)
MCKVELRCSYCTCRSNEIPMVHGAEAATHQLCLARRVPSKYWCRCASSAQLSVSHAACALGTMLARSQENTWKRAAVFTRRGSSVVPGLLRPAQLPASPACGCMLSMTRQVPGGMDSRSHTGRSARAPRAQRAREPPPPPPYTGPCICVCVYCTLCLAWHLIHMSYLLHPLAAAICWVAVRHQAGVAVAQQRLDSAEHGAAGTPDAAQHPQHIARCLPILLQLSIGCHLF